MDGLIPHVALSIFFKGGLKDVDFCDSALYAV
jgi:hypothetical protein